MEIGEVIPLSDLELDISNTRFIYGVMVLFV
jgi:hypothetical protein